ncbi:MAG: hypothetical protein NTW25_02975 [Candidatus Kapabacteria bacterium]|nr:hypothetical protein [Candidatus Kapabacteria bacterium]
MKNKLLRNVNIILYFIISMLFYSCNPSSPVAPLQNGVAMFPNEMLREKVAIIKLVNFDLNQYTQDLAFPSGLQKKVKTLNFSIKIGKDSIPYSFYNIDSKYKLQDTSFYNKTSLPDTLIIEVLIPITSFTNIVEVRAIGINKEIVNIVNSPSKIKVTPEFTEIGEVSIELSNILCYCKSIKKEWHYSQPEPSVGDTSSSIGKFNINLYTQFYQKYLNNDTIILTKLDYQLPYFCRIILNKQTQKANIDIYYNYSQSITVGYQPGHGSNPSGSGNYNYFSSEFNNIPYTQDNIYLIKLSLDGFDLDDKIKVSGSTGNSTHQYREIAGNGKMWEHVYSNVSSTTVLNYISNPTAALNISIKR